MISRPLIIMHLLQKTTTTTVNNLNSNDDATVLTIMIKMMKEKLRDVNDIKTINNNASATKQLLLQLTI